MTRPLASRRATRSSRGTRLQSKCATSSRGVHERVANAVLVKMNQNGTLTGTLDVIAQAKSAGYATIVSARSGETEDAFMADLAVGASAGQIKIGSLRTSSTVAKYNQLLRIGERSGAPYAGAGALAGKDQVSPKVTRSEARQRGT